MTIQRYLLYIFSLVTLFVSSCGRETAKETSFDPYFFLANRPFFEYSYVETVNGEAITVAHVYRFEINKEYGFFRRGYAKRGLEIVEVDSYKYDEKGTYKVMETCITFSPDNRPAYSVRWKRVKWDNIEIAYPDGRVWEYRSATE